MAVPRTACYRLGSRPVKLLAGVVAVVVMAACGSSQGGDVSSANTAQESESTSATQSASAGAATSAEADGNASTVSGANDAAFPADSTMAKIVSSGVLRAGVTPSLPGLSVKGLSGEWSGFNVEMTELLAQQLGVKTEYVLTTEENRIPFLQQRKVDVVTAIFNIQPEREKVVAFAGPYYISHDGILVRKGNPANIHSVADLAGKSVCAIQGSNGPVVVARAAPEAKLVEMDKLSKCVLALQNGTVDAVNSAQSQVGGFILDDPDLELTDVTLEPEHGVKWGIGLPKADVDFCEYINKFIASEIENGALAKAWDATIGDVGVPGPTTLPPDQNHCGDGTVS